MLLIIMMVGKQEMCWKTLFVGMSYRHISDVSRLPGIFEVISVRRFLMEEWKFKPENIEIMCDEGRPLNHVIVLKQLKGFVDREQRGDRLNFILADTESDILVIGTLMVLIPFQPLLNIVAFIAICFKTIRWFRGRASSHKIFVFLLL
jgi:hypothetical protein